MGSPPTLDPTPPQPPATTREDRAELVDHLQTPAAHGGHEFAGQPVHQLAHQLGGDLDALHDTGHTHLARALGHRHPDRDALRHTERAFDRLNPAFGVPADQRDPYGRQAVRDREAALTLGMRVAVHDSRQNDRDPVIWQPGQDYRMAHALHAARRDLLRTRQRPERTGPER